MHLFSGCENRGTPPARWARAAALLAVAVAFLATEQPMPWCRASQPPAPRTPLAHRPRLDLRIGHTGFVLAVVFSTDGNTLASASNDHTVKLWDVATGTLQRTLVGHTEGVDIVAFSPDGSTIASGSFDNSVKLWDAQTGRLRHTLSGHTHNVIALAFAPDRRMMASGASDGTVRLWDVSTGKELPTIDGNVGGIVFALTFSPDGRNLSVVEGGADGLELTGWDLATGQRLPTRPLEGSRGGVGSVSFSPDGRTVASGRALEGIPNDLFLWDAQTGKLQWRQPGDTARIFATAYSPDSKMLASASEDGTVRLWEVETGTPVRRLNHDRPVSAVAFSPDGKRLACGDQYHKIYLWEVPLGARLWSSRRSDSLLSVAVSRDGKLVASGTMAGTVRLWDTQTGALRRTLTEPPSDVRSVAFSLDGKTLVGGYGDHSARMWGTQTGGLLRSLTGYETDVRSVAFSPDGRILVTASLTLGVWDARTGRLLRTLSEHGQPASVVAFSPDGQTLASGHDDGSLVLWDVRTGEQRRTLTSHTNTIFGLAFSPDGRIIASGANAPDKEIRLWDAHTGALLRTLPGGRIWSLAFSPDGKTLAGGQAYSLRLWEVETGKLLRTMDGHAQEVMAVAFSTDGKRLISASDAVRIWNPADGRLLATLMTLPPAHPKEVAADWLAITPDGYYDCSPGTGRLIQWQVGEDSFPVEAYEQSFRRPDLLRKLLAGEVITQQPEIRRRFAAGQAIPPQVTITRPRDGQTVTGATIRVEVTVTDPHSDVRVEIRVNGRPVPTKPIVVGSKPVTVGGKPIRVPSGRGAKSLKLTGQPLAAVARPIVVGAKPLPAAHRFLCRLATEVPLPPGETQVTLKAVATDSDALQGWDELHLNHALAASAASRTTDRGDLYVLAIGVSRYQNPRYDLKYAAADARAFAGLWRGMEGSLYDHVHSLSLIDAQATAEKIQSELFQLLRRVGRRDSIALFLSGHGVQTDTGEFYFATHDIDARSPERVKETALPWAVFETILAKVDAKRVFLFLDACHSGSALGEQEASSERLAEALARHGNVLVFSSSRGGEFSYEDPALQHGAFTEALLEGIGQGKADLVIGGKRDGRITAAKLLAYLQARVPQLTQNRQTPTCPLLYDFGEEFLLARAR